MALLVIQRDVSLRRQLETTLVSMSEGQLSLLSNIFPR